MKDMIAGVHAALSLVSSIAEGIVYIRANDVGETGDSGVDDFTCFTKRVALFRIVSGVVYSLTTPLLLTMKAEFVGLSVVRAAIDLYISLARLGWWDNFKGDR